MNTKINFKELSKKAMSTSEVIANHEKISVDELITLFPQGVTIIKFDLITNVDGDEYAVFNFRENLLKYFNGGAILSKMAKMWADAYEGNVVEANIDLQMNQGVKVKLEKAKNKKGQNITLVTVVD